MSSKISLRGKLYVNKLTRSYFLDWHWNIRIVLKQENRLHVLENLIPNALADDAGKEVRNENQHHIDDDEHATYVKLASTSPEFYKQHEKMDVYTIIMHIK